MSFSSLKQGNLYNTFDFRNNFQNNYSSNDIYLEDSYTSTKGFILREGMENAGSGEGETPGGEGETPGGEGETPDGGDSKPPETEVSKTLNPYVEENERSEKRINR